ncbi:hypothetical protein QCE47_19985 [Caballeronia sp. LZ025]|uniref:hypothetical protein n=1 Tax=Caballeronia TaxID=1827195 RepID=UPI001FD4DFB2|nr:MULTISPECIES: hypothetical protein [Caballeronia]MDR5734593.1 hypothetical protein [Caballeronia sp. LZ025]
MDDRDLAYERCELFDHAARLCHRRALLGVRGEFLAKPLDDVFLLWKPATERLPLCCDEPIQAPSAGHTSLGHTPSGSGMTIALKVDVPRLPCKEVNP